VAKGDSRWNSSPSTVNSSSIMVAKYEFSSGMCSVKKIIFSQYL